MYVTAVDLLHRIRHISFLNYASVQEDGLRQVLEEMKALYEQNQQDV